MNDEKLKENQEKIEEIQTNDENKGEKEVTETKGIIPIDKVSPTKIFFANFIDGLIMYAIAIIGVSALDFIMRATVGFYIKDKKTMTTMIFLIAAIVYPTFMQISKKRCTVGQKQYDLKLFKIK